MNPDDTQPEPDPQSAGAPPEYPTFTLGERVAIKGYPFRVQRINASSIVFRPDVAEYISARRAIARMRAPAGMKRPPRDVPLPDPPPASPPKQREPMP